MKIKLVICIMLVLTVSISSVSAFKLAQSIDKAAYYKILKEGNVEDVDQQISYLEASSFTEKDAFKGTLLMRKAGLMKKAKEKMDLFKSGRIKLETALHAEPANTEYHFLRLIIQEHAPKVTKYKAQLDEDSEFIKKNYTKLPADVQAIVKDYSKTSTILHPEDF